LRWTLCVAALLAAGAFAGSQTASTGQMQQVPTVPQSPPFGEPPDPNDPMQHQRLERMEKARNVERQQQLVRDTDKLFALAKDLKDQVSKSNKDTLSIDVVKKAAEIEKLAKSVKDRMRG
jgi:hypothetical protein